MTRLELAERSRLSHSQVYMVEVGRSQPQLGTLQALARALGVSLADLVDDGRKPEPPVVGTKLFWGIVGRLRGRDDAYLKDVDLMLRALDKVLERRAKATDSGHARASGPSAPGSGQAD